MAKKDFPTLAVILLIFAVVWFLSDLNVLSDLISVNVPWIPTILAIVAIGMIFNRFRK